MNGIMHVSSQKFTLASTAKKHDAVDRQKITPRSEETPAYKVDWSQTAIKSRDYMEQLCKENGIDSSFLDAQGNSLHAEETIIPPTLHSFHPEEIITPARLNDGKTITGADLTQWDIEHQIKEFVDKAIIDGGKIESNDMFDTLIFSLNGYNGYQGNFKFFDQALDYLQKKDPNGTNDVISKLQDLMKQAQTGEYIFTKKARQEMDQRIKDAQRCIDDNQSQQKALQNQLKKLNEKLLAMNKEPIPSEEKRTKIKPIEEQIESIQANLSKLLAQQKLLSKRLIEVSTVPTLR